MSHRLRPWLILVLLVMPTGILASGGGAMKTDGYWHALFRGDVLRSGWRLRWAYN